MPNRPPPSSAASAADRELVQAVLAGRSGAFERLVRSYQGLCWHIIDGMVRHPDDTRELCQEAFLRIHRSLHQYRGESALKSWIGQVAYSVARRHLERKRIPLAEAAGADGLALAEDIGDGFDLEEASVRQDGLRRLHVAIDALPPLQRTVLTLYHLQELSLGEIAALTGLAEGTLKSHLFRSRKRLREILEPHMGVRA
ncbi:MAG: sigma-70 family RNA polymerase sigma factor [Pseudoxanthomonas sp.]